MEDITISEFKGSDSPPFKLAPHLIERNPESEPTFSL